MVSKREILKVRNLLRNYRNSADKIVTVPKCHFRGNSLNSLVVTIINTTGDSFVTTHRIVLRIRFMYAPFELIIIIIKLGIPVRISPSNRRRPFCFRIGVKSKYRHLLNKFRVSAERARARFFHRLVSNVPIEERITVQTLRNHMHDFTVDKIHRNSYNAKGVVKKTARRLYWRVIFLRSE